MDKLFHPTNSFDRMCVCVCAHTLRTSGVETELAVDVRGQRSCINGARAIDHTGVVPQFLLTFEESNELITGNCFHVSRKVLSALRKECLAA